MPYTVAWILHGHEWFLSRIISIYLNGVHVRPAPLGGSMNRDWFDLPEFVSPQVEIALEKTDQGYSIIIARVTRHR